MTASKVITLFEHQAISYQELGLPANDPLLDTLDRLNKSAGTNLLQPERNGMRATQYVGVIQAGALLFQILPKIDCDPDGHAEAPAGSMPLERILREGLTMSGIKLFQISGNSVYALEE